MPESPTTTGQRSGTRLVHPLPNGTDANNFGQDRGDHIHQGTDISAPAGTPTMAITDGTIKIKPLNGGAGNTIELTDAAGNVYKYFHLLSFLSVTGQKVKAGQPVGLVGSTGHSTGPHLHFEYHPGGGAAVNPSSLLASARKGGSPPQGPPSLPTSSTSSRGGSSPLADPSTWLRVAEVTGGLALIGLGIYVILDEVFPAATGALKAGVALAVTKNPKVAAAAAAAGADV